jgi:predicted transcriptional regulator of viral defense system
MPGGARQSARDTDTGAAASAARQKMWEVMSRSGSRGVTVTMIVNVLTGVNRSTVRRWLAEDIKRGVAERVMPGFYRMRPPGDGGSQHHGRLGRLTHPEYLEAAPRPAAQTA